MSNGQTTLLTDKGMPSTNADTAVRKGANAAGDGLESACNVSKKSTGELSDQPNSGVDGANLPN